MFLHVMSAKHIKGYQVEVLFNNGKKGIADLHDALNGSIFEPLQNLTEFTNFVVDGELQTIVWANGADLAPEYIYYQAFKKDPKLQSQFKKWGYIS